ncbi:MAG: hypothetical protein R6X25_00435 [Candidatus Krumholzibacteriia bacterium]
MKCERCGDREATVHYVDIVEGSKTSVWLCSPCARAEGVAADDDEEDITAQEALATFVGGLLAEKAAGTSERGGQEPCPECGFGLADLEEKGVVGCPTCYLAFREQVKPLLERYHRGNAHVGKTPRADGPRAALRRELAAMRGSLERAVAAESYEEAARLRDHIRQREQELARLATLEGAGGSSSEERSGPDPGEQSEDA